jgi:transaldolase/glucose-6-phosphate isomerase
MTKLNELAKLGQAIWLDYIQRAFMKSGELQRLIDMGLRGMTSNPTIFEKAIAGSRDYDNDIASLAQAGKTTQEIYEALAIADIRMAADLLQPVYNAAHVEDGYVSLEVSPDLAHDTQGTIAETSRLWSQVQRPNLMIKIPATKEGLPAIRQSIASGINVNVTLIFSLERYREVIEAYLQGLEARVETGKPLYRIASVASFFVSRLDNKIDQRLQAIIQSGAQVAPQASELLGRAAVNSARLAYQQFDELFHSQRFEKLASQGARVQRPLWASTSTKNPAYSDILYVQELIGAHTVNTLPQNTLEAFIDHGEVIATIENDTNRASREIQALSRLGISMEEITQELEDEGVASFAKSYQDLLTSIEGKRADLLSGRRPALANLGAYQEQVEESTQQLAREDILQRIWEQDYTVWKPDPKEIRERLGWLYIAKEMENRTHEMEAVAVGVRSAGYRRVILLGMGGSSLAPELFARTFGSADGNPELSVLDTTDPGAVLELESQLDYAQTLFVVSTKSGSTVETLSLFRYFYQHTAAALGTAAAGEHFIAITDPGSLLVDIAGSLKFRSVFLNDPNIGGRYSALSYFGLLPAALLGLDLNRLLGSARAMAAGCRPERAVDTNPAAWLGAVLGTLVGLGRDKLTFVLSPRIASFGEWVEQLIAESTGKEGKGILPIVSEELAAPDAYSNDRLFVSLHLSGEAQDSAALANLESAGHPVIRYEIHDVYDLGGQFFLWELATAIAGYFMGINPFNQPNVEAAKQRARQMVNAYKESGALPSQAPALQADGTSVFGSVEASSPSGALDAFLEQAKPGDYVALQAFLQPTESTTNTLQSLRNIIRERTHLATTLGYGPRFLHSTGQLHKGDSGNGLFIQFTADNEPGVPIPDEINSSQSSISFGTLKMAQALGDLQALQDAGRRAIRIHLEHVSAIRRLFDPGS